jgi:hypothetical protein
MNKYSNQIKNKNDILYNYILSLSRNKILYTKFNLSDTFQNRIHLIFVHFSFICIKVKNDKNKIFKDFYQSMFNLIFKKIEINMRESGVGDTTINKNMRFLVKVFYKILLGCEKYNKMSFEEKNIFLHKHLSLNLDENTVKNKEIVKYFNKYEAFCFDLSSDSVLKGELKFNFN